MLHAGRLNRRLFCLALGCALAMTQALAQTPALTTISDTVYRADGTPASGTLLISWPGFTTADGYAMAAGNNSVALGTNGSLTVQLAPNAGATPAGTTYVVTYQLSDGTVKTENWSVGSTSPETISEVRTLVGTSTPLTQVATQQYVNSALANVVHLSGSETITGAKQFTVSPVLPTPSQSGQAANKAYVDASVGNSGGGNFVSKAGDTMTGPLVLPADPTSPLQASDKHYVDVSAATKADLAGGIVPVGELASGVANNSACLHGDSTWGGCGASSGGSGLTAGMLAIKYATDFAWTQNPSADLTTAGAKTVTLAACPPGVSAAEPQFYIYVSGSGTAEAVLVTGGTCSGNGLTGTLQFTTVNAHPAGYAVGSASGGFQEALVAARFTPSNPTGTSQSGKVIVPPGELKAFARVSIRASNITVDFSGSVVECWMTDTCIFVGDPANSNLIEDVTLVNPRGRPTVSGGQSPFIEVNAQKTRIFNVATRLPFSGGTFSSFVQVDDDQAFLLDGLDSVLGGGVRCDSTVCNPVVYAPGPFDAFSAVGWLKHLNISLQCAGNGVDWESGNTLRISDSVIQGYAQYGVKGGARRGGYGNMALENVYEEVGSCPNPAGNIGQAGVIVQGNSVKIESGVGPTGTAPQFANTGSTDYRYYVVAHHATYGASNPLYAGNALSSGTGSITVTTPDIAGASTLDLLRVTVSPIEQAPFGTGNFAVVANVARTSVCNNGVCSFTDTQAALQTYTVAPPSYFPLLTYWPGNLVLGSNGDFLISGILKIRSKSRGLVGFLPNRAQREFSSGCTDRNIVLKARQMGITTYIAARFFIQTITRPGTMTVQVAHDQESAEEIFKIVHRFWENLPESMKRGALHRSRANVRQMVFPRLDSEYRVATAADVNAGRGLTIHNLHCSEVARWLRDGEETLASLRAAVPAEGEIVLESTPNGAGGAFYEEWQRAHETGYTRHFFPWWNDAEYRTGSVSVKPLTPEEEDLVRRVGLTEAQIAWRRTNRAQMRGLAAQEYAEDPVSCFLASGECVFELEAIDRALEAQGCAVVERDNGRLTIWIEPRYDRQYIIGVDPAGGGTDGDYACAEVIDRNTAMQCAELHGHYSPRELALKLLELARMCNSALLVVERNNHGYGVLANLRAAKYQKIFRDGGQDGWLTSAVTRPAMIENLAAILSVQPTLFQSTRLLTECRTFIRQRDGRSGGGSGSHDDCVMAMAIALAGREGAVGAR